jgi:hypothetical protein
MAISQRHAICFGSRFHILSFDKACPALHLYIGSSDSAEHSMPINRLLSRTTFDPEEMREIVFAYESVLASLKLIDRSDPATQLVASQVLKCAGSGAIDRHRLHDCALAALRN